MQAIHTTVRTCAPSPRWWIVYAVIALGFVLNWLGVI